MAYKTDKGKIVKSKLAKDNCPQCKHVIDAHSDPSNDRNSPDAGDFSVCLYCGSYLVFKEDLKLRLATDEEILEAPNELLTILNRFRNAARNVMSSKNKKV